MYEISHQCSSKTICVFSICINTLSHVTPDFKSVMTWKLNDAPKQNKQCAICAYLWLRSAWASTLKYDQNHRFRLVAAKALVPFGGDSSWSESSLGVWVHTILLVSLRCCSLFSWVFIALYIWSEIERCWLWSMWSTRSMIFWHKTQTTNFL